MREITLYPGESLVLADGTRVTCSSPADSEADRRAAAAATAAEETSARTAVLRGEPAPLPAVDR